METMERTKKEMLPEDIREEEEAAEVVMAGSLSEGLGGILAALLAVLALALFLPGRLGAIATIVIGIALLCNAGAVSFRLRRILSEVACEPRNAWALRGGLTAEFAGGCVGLILGVLALIGVGPITLLSVAAIVLGCALLLDTGALYRLNFMAVHRHGAAQQYMDVTCQCVRTAAFFQIVCGIAATVLGLLALVDVYPDVMAVVALLCIGMSLAYSGLSLSWRMLWVTTH
jgi:UPF0716 family protein affecting phage T7 exclusion